MEPIYLLKDKVDFTSLTSIFAQERVKYEYYREKIGEVDSSLQQLLVPYLFEFSGSDYISLQEKMPLLNQVGIYLEPYGNNTFILREHPIWMKEEEIESAVYEMCDMLLLTNEVSVKTYRAELAIMMSCKRSIKANHALDDYSARDLLYSLHSVKTLQLPSRTSCTCQLYQV